MLRKKIHFLMCERDYRTFSINKFLGRPRSPFFSFSFSLWYRELCSVTMIRTRVGHRRLSRLRRRWRGINRKELSSPWNVGLRNVMRFSFVYSWPCSVDRTYLYKRAEIFCFFLEVVAAGGILQFDVFFFFFVFLHSSWPISMGGKKADFFFKRNPTFAEWASGALIVL